MCPICNSPATTEVCSRCMRASACSYHQNRCVECDWNSFFVPALRSAHHEYAIRLEQVPSDRFPEGEMLRISTILLNNLTAPKT